MGIVLEQHPDRAVLFSRWKGLDWPLAVDPFNLLGVPAVPKTLAIDEHGVVRMVQPHLDDQERFRAEFVDGSFEAPEDEVPPSPPTEPSIDELRAAASRQDDAGAWFELAVALTQWGSTSALDEALEAARSAHEHEETAETHFALGVIHRRRYDSPFRHDGDFAAAVEHWTEALERDPNNYIYRRRIQQYGPRLAKPYPFYDWVARARQEIAARGESVPELVVEPGGTELAAPRPDFHAAVAAQEPDPDGRVARDHGLVETEVAVVPPAVPAGESVCVHVVFRPGPDAHWNNEADGLEAWFAPPDGWTLDVPLLTVRNPPKEISDEPRAVEFEVSVPRGATAGAYRIAGYSVYYVCEETGGTCLYRRRDLSVPVEVLPEGHLGLGDASLRT